MQSSWDFNQMYWEPPGFRFYFLFLLLVWGVTGAKAIKIWRALRSVETQASPRWAAPYSELRTSVLTFPRWMGLTLLGWGLFISISLGDLSARLLADSAKGKIQALLFVRGYAPTLAMALATAIVLYLIHWSLWKKIEKIAQDGSNRQEREDHTS